MVARRRRVCSICGVQEARCTEKRFFAKFPLDKYRCARWLKAVGNEDFAYFPIEKLQHRNVCGEHFTKQDFTKTKAHLKKKAVPTLNLTAAQPLPDYVIAEFLKLNSHIAETSNSQMPVSTSVTSAASSADSQVSAAVASISVVETTLADEHLTEEEQPVTSDVPAPSITWHSPISVVPPSKINQIQNAQPSLFEIDATLEKSKLVAQLKKTKASLAALKKSAKLIDKVSSPILKDIVLTELKNQKRKPQGKRWSNENKIWALELYKKSPDAYTYLQNYMPLPTVKTLLNIDKNPKGTTNTDNKNVESSNQND